ncbi:MAG: substrate-binding domain-containing protein [Rudanella sp.]|nr:substrate-binding domain-containing protein [Rudanella sp.]
MLAISDRIAYPALFILKQKGIRIPQDLAVASFNNEPISAFLSPALTSMSQPIQQMGAETIRLLLKQIDAGDEEVATPETVVMETQLVVRESSMRNTLTSNKARFGTVG